MSESQKQIVTVPLASLHHPDRNVRHHPEPQIVELVRAVAMFGQTRPMIIDETSTVLVGNGLLKALRRMEFTEGAVIRMEGLSPSDKTKLMLSDNRLYTLGFADYDTIIDLVRGMQNIDVPGFDETSLRSIIDTDAAATREALDSFGNLSAQELEQRRTPQATPQRTAGARVVMCEHCGQEFMLGRAK